MGFIEINGHIVNPKYILTLYKTYGVNSKKGEFALTCVVKDYDHIVEWFKDEHSRDKSFDELKEILLK